MNKILPWWLKILAKIVLSRTHFNYAFWQGFGLFRHGNMDDTSYVLAVFNEHVSRAGLKGNLDGKVILELGPGDSIATAVVARCYGARCILLDAGSFAVADVEVYKQLARELKVRGLSPPDISKVEVLDDILELCNAQYLTQGKSSLKSIETSVVDLIFSQAVLEHVRKNEFSETMAECFRVLKPEGVASHRVDLKDHLGGSLNNLRFSEKVWESDFFVNSGFYTNRIRFSEMITIFENVNFIVDVGDVRRWKQLPIKKRCLAHDFLRFSGEELVVSGFDVLLKKV